jgi:two-component system, OmpR family, alkaline phosphatase synthesis response regulator PhoP
MSKGKKILIVEDDQFLLKIYDVKFKKEGYDVMLAEDGDLAIELAKSSKPDLILLDLILPKKDGFDVLKELKSDAGLKDIPVIVLTNLGQDEDAKKGMELGADDYVIKANTSIDDVVEKAEAILR